MKGEGGMNISALWGISEEAREIHDSAIIVDACGTRPQPWELQRQAGVTALNATVTGSLNHSAFGNNLPEVCFQNITRNLSYVSANSNDLMVVTTVDDIRRCKRENKVGLIFHFQGVPWVPDISWIELFIRIGVKVMQLTYNPANPYASGCGEREDRGLTYVGRQVIREMNRCGALVDLSHLGHRSAMETLEASTKPVVLSHSNCFSVCPSPRNAKDDLIKAVAQTGGFVGMAVFAPMVGDGSDHFPTLDDYFKHVDYAVNLVGIDHVALGTDSLNPGDGDFFTWMWCTRHFDMLPPAMQKPPYFGKHLYHSVEGYNDIRDLPKITEGLVKRGYSQEKIHKFLGGNMLRVLEQVW
jgi:membrane dipeptidase